jgi:hypothetical protein
MKLLRIVAASLLVVSTSTSAFAEDFSSSIAKAVQDQRQIGENDRTPHRGAYMWVGGALTVGGLAIALYGFNHDHTPYPVPGEAAASNLKLGFSGLVVASGGGLLLFLGQRQPSGRAPSLTLGPGRVTLVKHFSW